MRAIKFKGKRVDYDEWVEGDLIHGVGWKQGKIYILPLVKNLASIKNCNPLDGCEVIPETVGQFTGLTDKNRKELYSSDIFKDEMGVIYRCYNVIGGFAHSLPQFPSTLKEETAWPLQPLADEQTVSWFESNCEVIGNIHENPEILNKDNDATPA